VETTPTHQRPVVLEIQETPAPAVDEVSVDDLLDGLDEDEICAVLAADAPEPIETPATTPAERRGAVPAMQVVDHYGQPVRPAQPSGVGQWINRGFDRFDEMPTDEKLAVALAAGVAVVGTVALVSAV